MKLYQKLISCILSVSLLVSLTACQSETPDSSSSESSSSLSSSSSKSDSVKRSGDESSGSSSESEADGSSNNSSSGSFSSKSGTAGSSSSSSPAASSSQTTTPTTQTVRITITEGQSMTQIFKKLEANGVASFDSLMNMAQNYDYSYYPLIGALPSNPNRCFTLEGYLFPDTYEFYVGEKPQDAIGRFLRGSKAKITSAHQQQAAALGYSMNDIMIIASLIQREGSNPNEMSKVSAVIHNRLKAGMKLEMDATINYIENNVKPYLSGDVNRYNWYYNTYKCPALPAGPICNPGMGAINAALNPANVSYLYFCNDTNGNYYYADTLAEHQENLKKAGIS